MRVLIVDDHAVFRRGLKEILTDAFDAVEVGEAPNGQEALPLVRQETWDLIILDVTMPGRHGLDILKDIKCAYPRLPVLVLSMHPEDQYAVRALTAGASGYLTKEAAPQNLVEAVKKALAGGKYITPTLAERLASRLGQSPSAPAHEALSDREYQVLCLLASGKTVSQVAEELILSAKTVSTYRTRILEKMALKNNSELTRYALENRLVT